MLDDIPWSQHTFGLSTLSSDVLTPPFDSTLTANTFVNTRSNLFTALVWYPLKTALLFYSYFTMIKAKEIKKVLKYHKVLVYASYKITIIKQYCSWKVKTKHIWQSLRD